MKNRNRQFPGEVAPASLKHKQPISRGARVASSFRGGRCPGLTEARHAAGFPSSKLPSTREAISSSRLKGLHVRRDRQPKPDPSGRAGSPTAA